MMATTANVRLGLSPTPAACMRMPQLRQMFPSFAQAAPDGGPRSPIYPICAAHRVSPKLDMAVQIGGYLRALPPGRR